MRSLIPLLALLPLAAACSGDDDEPRAQTDSIDSSTPSGTGDTTSPGSSGSGDVLGTSRASLQASSIDDRTVPLRLDLIRLERVGEMVELTLTLTNEAEPPADGEEPLTYGPDAVFSDGGYNGANTRWDASGIGLVDDGEQKEYLPVYDSEDNCLCTGDLNNTVVAPGGELTITATVGGVPDDVAEVDVRIPQFPTVSDVTIQ